MTIEEAENIIEKYNRLSDTSCSCHICPPCFKCVDMPSKELLYEAEQVLEENYND